MSSVGELSNRKEIPAHVKFERRAVEDRTITRADGGWPKKDVDYVLVTPPYSKDCLEQVAADWFEQRRADVRNQRLPEQWFERWEQMYEKWKLGQELPLDGEPIKGWNVISPAQQANLIEIGILTVERLAAANDEGKRRIGMGAHELVMKAKAWLDQMKDKGPLTQKIAMVEGENAAIRSENETLKKRNAELAERLEMLQRGLDGRVQLHDAALLERQHAAGPGLSAADIMPEPDEPPKRPVGRPRKAATTGDAGTI